MQLDGQDHFYFPVSLLPTLTEEELSLVHWYSLDGTVAFPSVAPYVSMYSTEGYAAREVQLKEYLIGYLGDGKFIPRPTLPEQTKTKINYAALPNDPKRHRSLDEILSTNKKRKRSGEDFSSLLRKINQL